MSALSTRRSSLGLVLGLAVILGAGSAGCQSVLELKVGDCYNGGGEGEVSTVEAKQCTEPHESEVFATLTHPEASGPYPGQVALGFYADRECTNAFDAYVGVAYDESELFVSYLTPTEAGWGRGDYIVTCVVTGADGETLTGSMKDARR